MNFCQFMIIGKNKIHRNSRKQKSTFLIAWETRSGQFIASVCAHTHTHNVGGGDTKTQHSSCWYVTLVLLFKVTKHVNKTQIPMWLEKWQNSTQSIYNNISRHSGTPPPQINIIYNGKFIKFLSFLFDFFQFHKKNQYDQN